MGGTRSTVVTVLLGVLFTLASSISYGQEMSVVSYTTSDGLPINLTKFAFQDETGFLWIATDGGLVRYDGTKLQTFTVADGLVDNYVKSVFKDSKGVTYVVSDRGVTIMTGGIRSPKFDTVLSGTSMPVDSMLFYPKAMFEDRHGNLWISDARGLVRMRDGTVKRFAFPKASWPDSYVRTYSLAEDTYGHLIVASERGHLYLFKSETDSFEQISDGRIVSQINAAMTGPDGTLWFGGYEGIYSLKTTSDGAIESWSRVNPIPAVLYLLPTPAGDVLVGTSSSGLRILRASNGFSQSQSYAELNSTVVNHLALDREGSLIVTTDNGFSILKPQFFESVLQFTNSAIETLARDPDGRVYGVREHEVFEMVDEKGSTRERVIFRTPEGLSAITTDGERIWAGSRNGSVYVHEGGRTRNIQLRSRQAINSMSAGKDGDVWVSHFKRTEIIRINANDVPSYYGPAHGVVSAVNVVSYLEDGLFAGADGDAYLLKYVPSTDQFSDVSEKLTFVPRTEIQVLDLEISSDGRFWLASSVGLLSYESDGVHRFASDVQLHDEEIRALTHDDFGNVWIGTGRGLFRLWNGQLSHFNRDRGLANLTMNPRSLVVDGQQRLWVGHFGGISKWARTPGEMLVTPAPVELAITVGGVDLDLQVEGAQVPYGSFVEVTFAALSHPGDNIRYESREVGGDGAWSQPNRQGTYVFSKVGEGLHDIEVRAQQDGYAWSRPTKIKFFVALPWYRQWWAFLIFVAASAGILYLMTESHNQIRTRQLKTQTIKLEKKVRERTDKLMVQKSAIEEANLQLKKASEQNHEFIGIAAHDLRNPLTSLVGFSELLIDNLDKSDSEDYRAKARDVLPIIHRAATTMHGVIQDMLDSQLVETDARELRADDTDLAELTRTVINMNETAARRKGITIMFNPREAFYARVNARGMQRVLDNLVSNAIKYSPPSSNVSVKMAYMNAALRICVQDEGPGLTLEDKEKVFGKLQRLSAKPTGGEPSTGLGLYIVRSIVEMHNGRVGVHSEPGEGAEFWIEVPVSELKAAA